MNLFLLEFSKIGILLLFSFCLASIILFLSFRFSAYKPDSEKLSAYECGFDPYEDARNVFDVRFYFLLIKRRVSLFCLLKQKFCSLEQKGGDIISIQILNIN